MARRPVIVFLTDQNVPDSIGELLKKRGHNVIRVRDIMPTDSADPIVAEAAMRSAAVLVSWDRDFHHQRFLAPRFKSLSRLAFSCPEVDGARRLKDNILLVEAEAKRAKPGQPMIFKIGKDKIQIGR